RFDQAPAGTRILAWQSQTNFASIRDGTSNTVLVGEKFVRLASRDGKREDRSVFGTGEANTYRRLLGVGRTQSYRLVSNVHADEQTWAGCEESFGSHHSGVCQFVMVDGSVQALKVTLSNPGLQYLGERSDGQVTPPLD